VTVAGGFGHSLGLKRLPTNCAIPEIDAVDPSIVDTGNCSDGCVVNFTVTTQDDYSRVQRITLERSLPGLWVEEDSIVAPIGDPDWTLACFFDGHFTDGPHTFRAVTYCQDGSKGYSFPVSVMATRSVAVLIASFEAERSSEGVLLRWRIAEGSGLQGFNIYRSLEQDAGFRRINEQLIGADEGNVYVDRDASAGKTYWYRVGAVASDGEWMSQTVSIAVPAAVLTLHQNVPNPFNPTTMIAFVLPERTRAMLAIYDIEGRHVRTLVDAILNGGRNETTWDGTDTEGDPVSSGVYLYRLEVGDQTITKKLTILK